MLRFRQKAAGDNRVMAVRNKRKGLRLKFHRVLPGVHKCHSCFLFKCPSICHGHITPCTELFGDSSWVWFSKDEGNKNSRG